MIVELLSALLGIAGFIFGAVNYTFGKAVLFGVIGLFTPTIISAISSFFYRNGLAEAVLEKIPDNCNSVFIGRFSFKINNFCEVLYKNIYHKEVFLGHRELLRFAKKIHRRMGRDEYRIREHKASASMPYATYNSGYFNLHSGGGSVVDGYYIEKVRYLDLY